MASLSYRVNEGLTLYATVAQGYKAGGFEKVPTTFVELSSVDSEKSLNIEAGVKGIAFDSRFQYSLTAFQIDIDDMQLMAIVDVMNIPQVVIDNAGASKSRGFEAEFSARFNENFSLGGNLGYTDTEFDEFVVLNRHNASFVGSDGSDPALILNHVGAPRTFGVRLDYRWQ